MTIYFVNFPIENGGSFHSFLGPFTRPGIWLGAGRCHLFGQTLLCWAAPWQCLSIRAKSHTSDLAKPGRQSVVSPDFPFEINSRNHLESEYIIVLLYHIISYYIISNRIIWYYIILWHIISDYYHLISDYIISSHIISYHIMILYDMIWHDMISYHII